MSINSATYRTAMELAAPKGIVAERMNPKMADGFALNSTAAKGLAAGGAHSSSAPHLWYEKGVVWAAPSHGKMYPVAFATDNDFINYFVAMPFFDWGVLNAQAYSRSPFDKSDIPGILIGIGKAKPGAQPSWVYACKHSVLPFARQALSSISVKVPHRVGAALEGLGLKCTADASKGKRTVCIEYILLVPDTSEPSNCLFETGSYSAG